MKRKQSLLIFSLALLRHTSSNWSNKWTCERMQTVEQENRSTIIGRNLLINTKQRPSMYCTCMVIGCDARNPAVCSVRPALPIRPCERCENAASCTHRIPRGKYHQATLPELKQNGIQLIGTVSNIAAPEQIRRRKKKSENSENLWTLKFWEFSNASAGCPMPFSYPTVHELIPRTYSASIGSVGFCSKVHITRNQCLLRKKKLKACLSVKKESCCVMRQEWIFVEKCIGFRVFTVDIIYKYISCRPCIECDK